MLNSSHILPEKELILMLSNGNEDAFAVLFHRYRDKLYSFILGISKSSQLAEDVVQEVFSKIWQKKSELGHIDNFNSYLYRMAHNQVINLLKRMAKETLILSEISSLETEPEPLGALEFKDFQAIYHNAIEKLPPKQKQVFTLSREDGMQQKEIAEKLNISIATVKSHMTQALRFLRKEASESYPYILLIILANQASS